MQFFEQTVIKVSRSLDFIAGIILAATALLVVANIVGRTLLQRSIQGSFEMVGYFTAAVVGLAMARCAVENGHIAVEFIISRFSPRLQYYIRPVINIPVFVFLCFTAYHLTIYGNRIAASGSVSPTAQIAFYPFIYLVALGFFVLALVILIQLIRSLQGGER